ncbi:MAG: hypothetical protein U5K75_11590 [Ahrensia sp.]|nr:hypothetical protein [Ahrensia sp.]
MEYEKVKRILEISKFTAEGMATIETAKIAAALALKDAGDDAGCAAMLEEIFPKL